MFSKKDSLPQSNNYLSLPNKNEHERDAHRSFFVIQLSV
jgi:hypothetical protein